MLKPFTGLDSLENLNGEQLTIRDAKGSMSHLFLVQEYNSDIGF